MRGEKRRSSTGVISPHSGTLVACPEYSLISGTTFPRRSVRASGVSMTGHELNTGCGTALPLMRPSPTSDIW
eukprot:4297055-Alexandrium_andersonii.AAC.1